MVTVFSALLSISSDVTALDHAGNPVLHPGIYLISVLLCLINIEKKPTSVSQAHIPAMGFAQFEADPFFRTVKAQANYRKAQILAIGALLYLLKEE